jgi:hypothetical protein
MQCIARAKRNLSCFDVLQTRVLWPTDIKFIGVLNAHSHAGLVEQGHRFFLVMDGEYRIEPQN